MTLDKPRKCRPIKKKLPLPINELTNLLINDHDRFLHKKNEFFTQSSSFISKQTKIIKKKKKLLCNTSWIRSFIFIDRSQFIFFSQKKKLIWFFFSNLLKGKIGITGDILWPEPKTNSAEDKIASELGAQFHVSLCFCFCF